jgi:hypothetical protein
MFFDKQRPVFVKQVGRGDVGAAKILESLSNRQAGTFYLVFGVVDLFRVGFGGFRVFWS